MNSFMKYSIISMVVKYMEDFQIDQFFSSFTFDSSFYRLKSTTLNRLDSDVLMSVLQKLITLPRLFSLTINISSDLDFLINLFSK
jgi:hypothetical protein